MAINLQPNLLEKFGVSLDFIANQKLQETNSDNKMIVGNNEISSAFRKLCYFTLVKWSNKTLPPASTKLHLFDIAGVQFIVTRFSEPAMQKVYGSILLPYIYSKHHALLFRLYEQSHIRYNPANSKDVGVYHLPLTSTLQNMRSGDYAAITNAQRKILSTLVSKCSFCILHGQSERLYSHQPGDPRILEFLHATDLPFHTISVDWLSEVWVKHHTKARGKPSHSVSILVAVDLATGAICLTVTSDSKSNSVIKALKQLGLRYRFPKRIITDQGSSLANLASHPELIEQLTQNSVELVSMPASHQFGNFSERQISQAKKILNSLREDVDRTIYNQNNSLEELYGKLFSVEAVMNSRPILLSNKNSDAMLICPKMLLSPYLTAAQLQSWVLDVLSPLTNPSNIASLIAKNHQVVASALQEALLTYLQSEGLRYSIRQGDKSKPDLNNLQPIIQDET